MAHDSFQLPDGCRQYLALFDRYLQADNGFDAHRLRGQMTAQARRLMDNAGIDVAHVAWTHDRKAA